MRIYKIYQFVHRKYTVRMVSEMILVFNCQLRRFDNKHYVVYPSLKNVTQRVYSCFILNSFRLMCYTYTMSIFSDFVTLVIKHRSSMHFVLNKKSTLDIFLYLKQDMFIHVNDSYQMHLSLVHNQLQFFNFRT